MSAAYPIVERGADPEKTEPADALRPVGMAEFLSSLAPPSYSVDGVLIKGYCYAVTGHPGHAKTAVALSLAFAQAMGDLFAARITEQTRVLYVAGENPDDVRMRTRAMLDAHGLDAADLEDRIHFLGRSFTLADRHAELMCIIERGGYGLVILDTDQALSSDADENDNRERVEHAKRVRMLTKTAPRPTVVVLCHPPASALKTALRPRGGSSFLAEIDGNLGVWIEEGDTRAELFRTSKFRGPMFDPMLFDIKVVDIPSLTDACGRAMTTVVAVDAAGDTAETDEAARKRRIALLADVSLHPGSTIRARAERTSEPRSTVHRDLKYLLAKKAISEAFEGHQITAQGKKWLAAS